MMIKIHLIALHIQVLGADGSGSFSNIIAGLHWVQSNVAANGNWPAVASLSLGGDKSQSLDDAVTEVVNGGIPVVVAAGNDFGADACTSSPAGAPAAITVGATDRNDKAAYFSNIGSCLDIWSPGVDVVSSWNTGDTATQVLSGTSMATPAVAGVVALIMQDRGRLASSGVDSTLASAAVNENFNAQSTTRFVQAEKARING